MAFSVFIPYITDTMKRQKDQTPITCQICQSSMTASGMPSHLYRKHDKMSSEEYVKQFGEFRQKHLKAESRKQESKIVCQICNHRVVSNKSLMQHIKSAHNADWKEYIITYIFNGVHPTCACGCGQEVELLRHGKDDRRRSTYAREFLSGHNTKLHHTPGYRTNTPEQRERMRISAINRKKAGIGTFFESGPSKEELKLQEFIKTIEPDVKFNDKTLLSGLEVDILVPSKKIAIEYNGAYFHSDKFRHKLYHLKKTKELSAKGYKLIHVWSFDWIHKTDIVKSMITSILGYTPTKVYARDTTIREISNKEAVQFTSQNHLQGTSVSKVRLGLFYNNELVSVMTFSSLRRATGYESHDNSYELVRFCSKKYTTVVGGASKLFNYFIKTYNPSSIISFANRDWSEGNLYTKLNMNFVKYTPPGYFYVKSNYKFSRFQFQKHKLIANGKDPNLTEYEIMTQDGYHRIWDTGNLLYEWNNLV